MNFRNNRKKLMWLTAVGVFHASFLNPLLADKTEIRTLKIICLNTAGIQPHENRYQQFINFINAENPDILGLLELNDWNKNNHAILYDFLGKTKFKDYIFGQANSDFHLAVFSKHTFLLKENLPEKMGHGLVHVKIAFGEKVLNIFLTHLTPGTEDARVREVHQITTYIKPGESAVLMGDLNSLSPNDPYDDVELLKIFQMAEIKKFGVDTIRKDVIARLKNAGLKDVSELTDAPFKPTVPTRMNSDAAHASELRLDYIFVTSNLKKNILKYHVVKTSETDRISDHYPVLAELVSK